MMGMMAPQQQQSYGVREGKFGSEQMRIETIIFISRFHPPFRMRCQQPLDLLRVSSISTCNHRDRWDINHNNNSNRRS